MSVNYYDLLDVAPEASTDEIREAWRTAVDGLDPTSRRFRAYNTAAEVLLDPQRRSEYDAELNAQTDVDAGDAGDADAVDEAETDGGVGTDHESASEDLVDQDDTEPEAAPDADTDSDADSDAVAADEPDESDPDTDPESDPDEEAAHDGAPTARAYPRWLPLLLGALALLTWGAVLTVLLAVPSQDDVDDAAREAESAAQSAVPVILSYDYANLDGGRDEAMALMTSSRAQKYEDLFEGVLRDNIVSGKVKVEASYIASGVVRTGSGLDADNEVQVLVVFDQVTTNKAQAAPVRTPAFATLTMREVDGEWLVDQIAGPPVLE